MITSKTKDNSLYAWTFSLFTNLFSEFYCISQQPGHCLRILDFTAKESCGKCVHCRIGTKRLLEILDNITKGKGKDGDIELLTELCNSVKDGALCGLGQTAPNPVLSTIRYFRDEYEAHINEKRCPVGECADLITYEILTDKCRGCTLCAKKCPVDAISGALKTPHTIDTDKCIKCGQCITLCRFDAIIKR